MSEAPPAKPAGVGRKPLVLKGLKKGVHLAPQEDLPQPQDVALSVAPSTEEVGQVARTFFKKPSAVPVSGKVMLKKEEKPAAASVSAAAALATTSVAAPAAPAAAVAAAPDSVLPMQPQPEAPAEESFWKEIFNESDLADLAEQIENEKTKNPYSTPLQTQGYIPQTRRAFSQFIRETYAQFTLPPPSTEPDYDACFKMGAQGADTAEIYQYQQFVRDYMSFSTPYRGVLVYHGLGSGKTCTAIAAAEALFSTANRKIIVMTPKSIRENFVKEITFCGFRHFRLKNHWVSYPNNPSRSSMINIFARNILNIPESYLKKAKRIWIPDFSKAQNYESLTSEEQTEIREQIEAILIFDPALKKDGRIWFINYNGITPTRLKQIACMKPSNAFDNAVIVIDEIHNLTRLMQGAIEPYIVELKGVKRKMSPEPITWEKWSPKLCGKDNNYVKAYLFYRLLIDAKNTKIIGLSGTPLINFPEELGILSNILHGYVHIVEGRVQKTGSSDTDMQVQKQLEDIAEESIYVDFYRITIDDTSIRFVMTMLPEGIRKVATFEPGVERIPLDEPTISFGERVEALKQAIEAKKLRLLGQIQIQSEPLLPPVAEHFKNAFLSSDNITIKNKAVLIKRLTGLISYYKGSRKDLMPTVTVDAVVRVPFSEYQQTQYTKIRLEEIDIETREEKKGKGGQAAATGKLGEVWAQIYEIKNETQNSNYRMGSRQACNFTLPSSITRPRPQDEKEAKADRGKEVADISDIASNAGEDEKEEQASTAEDAAIKAKEEEVYLEGEKQRLEQEGKGPKEVEDELSRLQIEYRKEKGTFIPLPQEKVADVSALTEEEKQCRIPRFPGESISDAYTRCKKCLATIGKDSLIIKPKGGLQDLSTKYLTMIDKIMKGKGSSLVYSQFLAMEGIGIFSVVLKANGFDPIVVETTGGEPRFSAETIASLQKGPAAKQPRFITFTGEEEEEVRRFAVDLFNAKFSSLPKAMADVLTQAGYTDNKEGELCRIFCITSAGAEGLSLKNVRMVHIMEPYWNDVRLTQVKGRAVRICSHMGLPPAERTVEVYTYISVFGAQAQTTKEGPFKIDENIRKRDTLSLAEAAAAGITVPPGAQEYVVTSDERLFIISERKKKLIQNLQNLMKASAVDCQLNYAENKDGTFTCAIFDKVGDFMYYPSLQQDIEETGTRYRDDMFGAPAAAAAAPVPAEGVQAAQPKTYRVKIRDQPYMIAEQVGPITKRIEKYSIHKVEDLQLKNPVGEILADPLTGKPKAGTAKFFGTA